MFLIVGATDVAAVAATTSICLLTDEIDLIQWNQTKTTTMKKSCVFRRKKSRIYFNRLCGKRDGLYLHYNCFTLWPKSFVSFWLFANDNIPSHVGAKNKNKRKKCNIAHKEEQHWVRPNRKLILFESSQIDRENAFEMMRDSQANKNTERHKSNEYVKKKRKTFYSINVNFVKVNAVFIKCIEHRQSKQSLKQLQKTTNAMNIISIK